MAMAVLFAGLLVVPVNPGEASWPGASTTSLVIIPIIVPNDLIAMVQRLRKSLRDVRDRVARIDP